MNNKKKNVQSYKEELRILRKAMLNQKLVVFVGAGISLDSGMPSWGDAIRMIAEKLGIKDDGNLDYMKIPQYYYNARGNKEYVELMREIFKYTENLEVQDVHRNILKLNTHVIVTTNYDNLIEKAAEENAEFIRVISQDKDLPYQNSEKQLLKIHGDFEHGNFVLKEDDYLHYDTNFKLIETYIKSLVATNVVLFIGYSFGDPDVKQIFTWVKDILEDDFQRAYMFNVGDEFAFDEWYKQNQISKHAYYYWRRKVLDSMTDDKTTCFAEVTHLMEASHNNSGTADGLVINNRYCSLTIHNKNEAALAAVFIKELCEEC